MSYSLSEEKPVLTLVFANGLTLSIRYNDFHEYSYQLTFSRSKYDRIRFDNYDKNWDVSTNPHHLHGRGKKEGVKSIMTGNPSEDMEKLVKFIEPFVSV